MHLLNKLFVTGGVLLIDTLTCYFFLNQNVMRQTLFMRIVIDIVS